MEHAPLAHGEVLVDDGDAALARQGPPHALPRIGAQQAGPPLLDAGPLGAGGALSVALTSPDEPPYTVRRALTTQRPSTANAEEPTIDPWFAEDKARHATLSFAAVDMAYGAGSVAGLGRDEAVWAAAGFALAAGVWKEWRDERSGGGWSGKDLVWDLVGVAAGVLWVRQIQ